MFIWNINKETSLSEDYIQTTCISSDHDKNTRKVWKKIGIKLQELRTQGTHYPYTLIVFKTEKWLSSKCGKKWQKHLYSFKKTGIKLLEKLRIQGYPIYIHFDTIYYSRLKND